MASSMFVGKNKIKNRKAISELVSYVLLITLAIAMAAAAWFFLKPYAERPLPEEECPETVTIVLENYTCNGTHINYTLKNRGLHTVTGVKLNAINDSESNLEYDFQWLLPSCTTPSGPMPNCTQCSNDAACLPAGRGTLNDIIEYKESFNKIEKLVIYPLKVNEKGQFQVCTASVQRIAINCG